MKVAVVTTMMIMMITIKHDESMENNNHATVFISSYVNLELNLKFFFWNRLHGVLIFQYFMMEWKF
jgi:hypothetical protein